MRAAVRWCNACGLANGDDGLRQVVVDMGVHARHGKLDARNHRLIALIEESLPAAGCCLARERGLDRVKVEACELDVERGHPRRIAKFARAHPCLHCLGHLEIKPVEPLQAVAIRAIGLDGLHDLDHVRNRLRGGSNCGHERGVVGEHGVPS